LPPALTALQTFQKTSGTLAALQTLIGQTLPASGTLLTTAQIEFLYTQLFDVKGNQTLAYSNPTQAAANLNAGANYLTALQVNKGAGIQLLNALAGQNLPTSGPLTSNQLLFLFTQLFTLDAKGNVVPTQAYTDPGTAVQNLQAASNYLNALRTDKGALTAFNALTGLGVQGSGSLTPAQLTALFGQLFTVDSKGNVVKTQAYNDPNGAATTVIAASNYLNALRIDKGALTAFNALTGLGLPGNGALTANQLTALFGQLFTLDAKGNIVKTQAYGDPNGAAANVIAANNYLIALRANKGAGLKAFNDLTGLNIQGNGSLTMSQLEALFGDLFTKDKNGNVIRTQVYSDPSGAAANVIAADNYLIALRANKGAALNALNALTGLNIQTTGALTTVQLEALFGELFTKDIKGNVVMTQAFSDPKGAAANVIAANNYLIALRANKGAGLKAFNDLTGLNIQGKGSLTAGQLEALFGDLFTTDSKGHVIKTQVYSNPSGAAANVIAADNYLKALRAMKGAALSAFNQLTGVGLPANGGLTPTQLADLFAQLFTKDNQGNVVHTQAYSDPKGAAANVIAANNYLIALRANKGAGLKAFNDLTGLNIQGKGSLTAGQLEALFGDLFTTDSKGNVIKTQVYSDPKGAAANVIAADNYLKALRTDKDALAAFNSLTGLGLKANGSLTRDQLMALFGQLFTKDKNGNVIHTQAYSDPKGAAANLIAANNYLVALRKTPGALDALKALTGVALPAQGGLSADQLQVLFGQLFTIDDHGNVVHAQAYTNPAQAAETLLHADAFVIDLRATPGALTALQNIFDISLSPTGSLSADQIQAIFGLMFLADGTPSLAYTDPQSFVNILVGGGTNQPASSVKTPATPGLGTPSQPLLPLPPSDVPRRPPSIGSPGASAAPTIIEPTTDARPPSQAYRPLAQDPSALQSQIDALNTARQLLPDAPAALHAVTQASAADKDVIVAPQ